ncbi:MAG TPA: hypothetical protein VII29_08025 [Terriglobales bacterium]
MGAAQTGGRLCGEGGGGEIYGPVNHSGCVKVYTPGAQDAADFGPVAGKIAARVWDAPAEDKGTASCPSHVVEAGAGVKVMAAAGASANGGSTAAQAAGKIWWQVRMMRLELIKTSAGSFDQGRVRGEGNSRGKCTATLRR